MNDDVRNIVLGVLAVGVSAALGWLARTYLWKRRLRRKQAFFGLPDNSESLLVVNREAGGPELTVMRHDVFALLELSALIKDCGAHAQVIAHDATQQGFGERTEFCVGGPSSNRRMAAHLHSLLPGVDVNVDAEPGPDRGAFQIGSERYLLESGKGEYVILARLVMRPGARDAAGVPLLRPARDHQPGRDPLPRPQPRASGAQTRRELLRPAPESGELAGVRPRCGRTRRGRDPRRQDPAAHPLAGTGTDTGAQLAPRVVGSGAFPEPLPVRNLPTGYFQ